MLNYNSDIKLDEEVINHPLIKLLSDMLEEVNGYEVEASKKIYKEEVYTNRMNIIFRSNFNRALEICLRYITTVKLLYKINIDIDEISYFINRVNKTQLVVLGFDLRKNIEDARVKIWIEAVDSPEVIYRALDKFGCNDEVLSLLANDDMLIGFDNYMYEKPHFKIHYMYDKKKYNHIVDLKLKNSFDSIMLKCFDLCDGFYISFRGKDKRKFIYLVKNDLEEIIKLLDIQLPILKSEFEFKGIKPYIVAFFYDEYKNKTLEEINLYYII